MIIDCHGHYTTEPKDLHRFRKEQTAAATSAEKTAMPSRASLENVRRRNPRKHRAEPAQAAARARHRCHHLLAARLRHGPSYRRRERQPGMVADLQRPDRARGLALSAEFHRRVPIAAVTGRRPEELGRRARALREDGLRRLQPQSGSVRRLLQFAADDRQVVVPALREDDRARRAVHDPRLRLLQSGDAHHRLVLSQCRHHGVHAGPVVRPVQDLSQAEIHHPARRRRGAVPLGPIPRHRAQQRQAGARRDHGRQHLSSTPASITSRASICSPKWCRSTTSCLLRRWSAR